MLGQRNMEEPGFQLLPKAEDISGKEVHLEGTPGRLANSDIMLDELSDQVEVGLKKRFVTNRRRELENGEAKWLTRFEAEFQGDAPHIYRDMVLDRDEASWDADLRLAKSSLQELLEELNKAKATTFKTLGEQIGIMTRQFQVSEETDRTIRALILQATEDKDAFDTARNEAIRVIKGILDEQTAIKLELTQAMTTSWDSTSNATKAFIKRRWFAKRWAEELGTIEREAELDVLKRRYNAPYEVHTGHERKVYEAILEWRKLKAKMNAGGLDQTRRAEIGRAMKEQAAVVQEHTSTLTGTFDSRFEQDADGISQAKGAAWAEIHDLIDKNRTTTGDVKKTFLEINANYDRGSIETANEKAMAFFQFGIAKNALKQFGRYNITQYLRDFPYQTMEEDPELDDKRRPAMVAEKRDAADAAHQEATKLREIHKELNDKQTETQLLYEDMAAAVNELKTQYNINRANAPLVRNPAGGADIPDPVALREYREQFQTRLAHLVLQRDRMQKALAEARNETKAADQRALAAERDHTEKQAAYSAINTLHSTPTDLATRRATAARTIRTDSGAYARERLRDLRTKLQQFVGQDNLRKDFYSIFNDREILVIAKICGEIPTQKHERTGRRIFAPRVVETCGGADADYWFINPYAIPEWTGKVSNDVVRELFDNAGRYPEVQQMVNDLKTHNKIVIVAGFPVNFDLDGGMNEQQLAQTGQELDLSDSKFKAMKAAYGFANDSDFFARWLDDLELQEKLGMRPEEMEDRYATWMAKRHLLRNQHFAAGEGWTYVDTAVASSARRFVDTAKRLRDGGYELTGVDFRRSPYYNRLIRDNEYAVTVTENTGQRKVSFRNQELTEKNEAPQTVAKRLYDSYRGTLNLYYQRTQIGGQSTAFDADAPIDDLGNFVQANMALIQKKMQILKSIYEYPTMSAEEKISNMIRFRSGDPIFAPSIGLVTPGAPPPVGVPLFTDANGNPDPGMIYLTYDIVTAAGDPNLQATNPELWAELDATVNWQKKLNTDYRDAEQRLVNTLSNRSATAIEIDTAEAFYDTQLQLMRNYKVRSHLLGMQAAGRFSEMDSSGIAEYMADMHSDVAMTAVIRRQELEMAARNRLDTDHPRILQPLRQLAVGLVGKLARNRVADFARGVGNAIGVGDKFLRELDERQVTHLIENKVDDEVFRRVAAHVALNLKTGYSNNFWHVRPGNAKSDVYPRTSDVRDLLGLRSNQAITGGVEMTQTGQRLLKGLMKTRLKDDVNEAVERTIRLNMSQFVRAGKKGGWNVDEVIHTYLNAKMKDTQRAVFRSGRWETNMYATTGTPIAMADRWLMQLIRERTNRGTGRGWFQGLMPSVAANDTRPGPINENRTTVTTDYINRP